MTTRPHPGSGREMRGPLQSFDLDAEVSRLRGEKEWRQGGRNAITLRKGEGLSVVLLAMKAGDQSKSTPRPVRSRSASTRAASGSRQPGRPSRPEPAWCWRATLGCFTPWRLSLTRCVS